MKKYIQNIKIVLVAIIALTTMSCETQQDVFDTGVANAFFDGNMLQYLESDKENWALTVEMIKHAGMEDIFNGSDPEYPEITFFGITSYSIQRFLWDNDKEVVTDLTPEECEYWLTRHIIKGKHLKASFPYRDTQYEIFDENQTGYTDLVSLGDNVFRTYLERTDYADIPNAGPTVMLIFSLDRNENMPLASPDIQPDNGVVHSLNYSYVLGRF